MITENLEVPTTARVPVEMLLRHSAPAQSWQLATPTPMLFVTDMSPYRPSRREFLIGAGSLLVLAPYGCGSDDGAGGETTSGGTRTVEHGLGTTEVPENPQRVAALSEGIAGHLVSVGLVPVAADKFTIGGWLEPYRELLPKGTNLEDIENVGASEQPNLEALTRIGPDLIIARSSDIEGIHSELSQIAPTVGIERPTVAMWKQSFDKTVQAVGRTEEAAEVRQSYQDEVAAAPERASETKVAFIRARDDGTFRVDGTGGFGGSVVAEAGFAVDNGPEGGSPSEFGYVEYSGERLGDITADLIVVPDPLENVASRGVEAFQRNPLWEGLSAVQADRVLEVPNPIYNGGTYVSAELLLRVLRQFIAREETG